MPFQEEPMTASVKSYGARLLAVIGALGIHGFLVYVATFVGFILAALCVLVIPGAGKTSNAVGRLLDPPFWLSEIVGGVVVGWFVRRRIRINDYGYAVVIPVLPLILDIVFEGIPMRKWTSLSDIYFSSDSGGTEGVYKLMFVAPVYAAISYVVGSGIAQLVAKRSQSAASKIRPPLAL